ncbi:hypothetical protein GQ600_12317 [Phytophthora cactorum]|nr:hypothetical protein GQ600_12317 [Phytophthora cactorum]
MLVLSVELHTLVWLLSLYLKRHRRTPTLGCIVQSCGRQSWSQCFCSVIIVKPTLSRNMHYEVLFFNVGHCIGLHGNVRIRPMKLYSRHMLKYRAGIRNNKHSTSYKSRSDSLRNNDFLARTNDLRIGFCKSDDGPRRLPIVEWRMNQ